MLTDLSFLSIGKPFPPEDRDTRARLKRYAINRAIFEGEHATVYEQQFKRIERVIGNFGEVISYPVLLNYQKLISLKVGDLLFGEFPKISCGEDDSPEYETIETICEDSDLVNTLYESAIDVSRYGDAILYVYSDEGRGKIDVSQPSLWFPVVSADNVKKILHHVLAWSYEENSVDYLKAQVHSKGVYTESVFLLEKSMSGSFNIKSLLTTTDIKTGLDDFAIVHVPNVMTSDRVTGLDDYSDIDTIVSELLVRVGQISKVLDKHAAPSVSGPSTALEKDPTSGEWRLKMGNYFPRDSADEPTVDYVTWDANLDSSFKQIEVLINSLYIISEMGAILLGDVDKMGNSVSGTALRLKMMSPLAKVKRVSKRFAPAIKSALRLCSQLGGAGIANLNDSSISITWMDGIPNDDTEIANIINIRTGGKASMSVKRALMQYDEMCNDEADEELALIAEEDAAANPMIDTISGGSIGDSKNSEDGEE
jgi:hypothetical protein